MPVLKVMLAASIVAIVALGTAAASASHYPRKLAPWSQLAQATETPRDETGGPAPAEVTTAVLEQQDVKSVMGRQVRSNVGEDMGRVVNAGRRSERAGACCDHRLWGLLGGR